MSERKYYESPASDEDFVHWVGNLLELVINDRGVSDSDFAEDKKMLEELRKRLSVRDDLIYPPDYNRPVEGKDGG